MYRPELEEKCHSLQYRTLHYIVSWLAVLIAFIAHFAYHKQALKQPWTEEWLGGSLKVESSTPYQGLLKTTSATKSLSTAFLPTIALQLPSSNLNDPSSSSSTTSGDNDTFYHLAFKGRLWYHGTVRCPSNSLHSSRICVRLVSHVSVLYANVGLQRVKKDLAINNDG